MCSMRTAALALVAFPLATCAQTAPLPPPAPIAVSTSGPSPALTSSAEQAVRETIARDGVHVVHFWAPWCDNSTDELAAGWYEVVDAHPEASFTFVTVWNDGQVGEHVLARYAIPERVERLVVDGPQPLRADRRLTFLGLPVSWIPTTWVFNRGGELATAFNYGEATPEQLNAAIRAASRTW